MDSSQGKSAKSPNQEKPKALSRLKEELGKDPFYLGQYWVEHKDNFHAFFSTLLEPATITKLISNAKDITLKFIKRFKLAPDDYTENIIAPSYDNLAKKIQDKGKIAKEYFYIGMNFYWEVIADSKKESGSLDEIPALFEEEAAEKKVRVFGQDLLGKHYEAKSTAKFFYPQLALFFERFFEIYDSSIQGQPAIEVVKNIERQQQEEKINKIKSDPNVLKNVWKQTNENAPMGPTQTFNYDRNEDPSNPAIEEELENLGEAYTNARFDFQALFNFKGEDFLNKWKELNEDQRKEWIKTCRNNIASRAEMGIMYCPELNEDLAKGENLPNLLNECKAYKDDVSQLDQFTSNIYMQMKSKGNLNKKGFLTLVYSRRWTLCTFCTNTVFEVLELWKENEAQGKGESEGSESDIQKLADIAVSKTVGHETKLAEKDRSNPLEKTATIGRKCGNPDCLNRETQTTKFSVCGNCKKAGIMIPYCSRDCQTKHWKNGHKEVCAKTTSA